MNINQQTEHTALVSKNSKSVKTTKHSQNGFSDLGIAPSLIKAINRLKFEEPTPIQKGAIPVGIQGDDVIALAQTGSGKTLAFGIPMLQRLSKSKRGTGLVLVPTRELAIQVEEALQAISRPLGIRSAVLIGGASMIMQINILKKNSRIIIATPGRLMDHLERGTVNLSQVETFVLDEADRMLDMGFVPDIKQIMKSIPEKRQTMLFSATMPKPIENIAKQLMENPVRLEIDRSGATPAQVKQEIFMIKNTDKSRVLAHHFKQCTGPVLVFTRTKRMATKLTSKVHDMGFSAAEIHSDRSQGQRRNALEGFKRGRYQILIATDIAARGIDVKGIELVVNYDMPANSEDYVHRIGRTGRAGKVGHAISFATSAQKGEIRDIERFMKIKLEITKTPTTLSEKELFKAAEHLNLKEVFSKDSKPPRRKSSRNSTNERPSSRKFQADRPSRGSSTSERPARRRDSSNQERANRFSTDQPEKSREYNSDRPKSFSQNRFGSKPRGLKNGSQGDEFSSKKRFSNDRTTKRRDFFKSDEKKTYKYDSNSKPREFKRDSSSDERPARKFSKDRTSKRKDFKKGTTSNSFNKRFDTKKNDLNDRSSRNQQSKESFAKSMDLLDSNSFLKDGGNENPFWSKFASKKSPKKPNKKRTVGQGSGRKR